MQTFKKKKKRPRNNLRDLSQSGCNAKRQRRIARSIIFGGTMKRIQESNAANHTKQRLYMWYWGCSNSISQGVLARNLSNDKAIPYWKVHLFMQSVTTKFNNKCLENKGECITTTDICEMKDSSTMSDDGFARFYRKFQHGVKTAGSNLRVRCLPRPGHVTVLPQGDKY